MKGVLYIPYSNGNCVTGFLYDKPLTAKQFVEMEQKEYDDHKDGVDTMMYERYGMNMAINHYEKRKFKLNQQSYDFHKCDCFLINVDGQQMSYEELKNYIRNQEQFILIVNLNEKQLKSDADMETDLKMWIDESNKVKNCKRLDDAEVLFHLPKKDFKFKLPENDSTVVFKECKFMEIMSTLYVNSFAVIVNKAAFIKD